MKKSDMENHHGQHLAFEEAIRVMVENRQFPAVFSVCRESFPHIVPAMKFRKQASIVPEIPPLLAFSIICQYGPPLFDHASLEALLDFVTSTRVLAKHENGYLRAAEAALEHEEMARTLWNWIERQPGVSQSDILNGVAMDHNEATHILETWERCGVLARRLEANHCRLYFRTALDAEVEGVCPSCGGRGKGRKEALLKPLVCQRCRNEGYYHIRYTDPN